MYSPERRLELLDPKLLMSGLSNNSGTGSESRLFSRPQTTTQKAAEAWATTDFRPELKNVTVPTLIVHGDSDNIVPIKTSAEQAAKGIANNEYHIIEGAPHGLNATHAFELNSLLLSFLNK